MIHLKSNRELKIMRRNGQLVARILSELAGAATPGVKLSELDQLAETRCREAGAKPAFKGYRGFPYALCTSVNEQIIHGMPLKRELLDGDIVGIDFGIFADGFFGDSALTVPVGKISERALKLMRATRASLYAGIEMACAGNTLRDVARAIESTVTAEGFSVVREFVGHGIGQNLHEDPQIPNYESGAANLKLKPGMTLCLEPMINEGLPGVRILSDQWTAVTEDGKLSAHYEHMIAVTEKGPEILTEWEGRRLGCQIDV